MKLNSNKSFKGFQARRSGISVWIYALLLSVTSPVIADELDTFTLRAQVGQTYDNNIFRRSANTVSDKITVTSVGLRVDKDYSLQRFLVDLAYIDYKYDKTDFLDYQAKNYTLAWYWALTPSLTGTLSTDRVQQLNDFRDLANNQLNIRTVKTSVFNAEFSPHNTLFWSLGFTNFDVKNSQQFNAQADFNYNSIDYGVGYRFASGSKVTLLAHNRTGEFQNRPLNPVLQFDNGFQEAELEVKILYNLSGRNRVTGKFAYTDREYNNFSQRDYAEFNGNILLSWDLTGKLRLNAGYNRSLAGFEQIASTYTIMDELNGDLIYEVSSKVQARLNAKVSERDFMGRGQFNTSGRVDDEYSLGATLLWKPIKNVNLTAAAIQSKRDSTISLFDFDDTLFRVTLDLNI